MPNTTTKVALAGAAGRMGRRVIELINDEPGLGLVAALDTPEAIENLPPDLVRVTDPGRAVKDADVFIDFAAPPICAKVAPMCVQAGVAYLVATTGLAEEDTAALERASKEVPVLVAANLSIGVNLLLELVETAVARTDFQVEITEIHHRHKRDAPSGTALALADAARKGRPGLENVIGRSGVTGGRRPVELGIHAVRGGDVTGEHTVFLLGEGERLELTHRAGSRDIFARGALRAAGWLAERPPGLYRMRDVVAG